MRAAVIAVTLAVLATHASAAELLFIHSPTCPWCERWNDEVGVIYDKTPEGRKLPLRKHDLSDVLPERLRLLKPVQVTPTFVFIEDAREVARITGYQGEEFFWSAFDRVLNDLAADRQQHLSRAVPVND